jgi:hypothetical protein
MQTLDDKENYFSSDDEDDPEVTIQYSRLNQPLKRIDSNQTNPITSDGPKKVGQITTKAPEVLTPEEEQLKKELMEEAERIREERLRKEEDDRKKREALRLRQSSSKGTKTTQPTLRDESELTEKQLEARRKREKQREEMLKLRNTRSEQPPSSICTTEVIGKTTEVEEVKKDSPKLKASRVSDFNEFDISIDFNPDTHVVDFGAGLDFDFTHDLENMDFSNTIQSIKPSKTSPTSSLPTNQKDKTTCRLSMSSFGLPSLSSNAEVHF